MVGLKSIPPLVWSIVAALMIAGISMAGVGPVAASTSIQSSVSSYINCPSSLSFDNPSGTGSCPSADFTGVYTGIGQTLGSTQDSVFYMASANGQVKVNYTLTDVTSGKLLLKWVAAGTLSGGSCSSPSEVLPTSPVSGTTYFVISSGDVINSGDTLKVHLIWTSFSGTGSPTFCSGGGKASVVSVGTAVITGSSQPLITNLLTIGVAHQTMIGGYTGVGETFVNTGSNFTAQILGVLKDSSGRTVDVLATSIVANPNVNVTAFLVFNVYPSGSYTLNVFALTNHGVSVSSSAAMTVTV